MCVFVPPGIKLVFTLPPPGPQLFYLLCNLLKPTSIRGDANVRALLWNTQPPPVPYKVLDLLTVNALKVCFVLFFFFDLFLLVQTTVFHTSKHWLLEPFAKPLKTNSFNPVGVCPETVGVMVTGRNTHTVLSILDLYHHGYYNKWSWLSQI